MILRRISATVFAGVFALATLGARPCTAAAQNGTRGAPTPPRLRFTDGAVSFWRTGAADWSTAQVNTALAAGDSLYAGDAANLEIQIGPQAFIRAGAATEIDLTALSADYLQFRITGGHAAFDLQNLPRGQTIEIDTPNAVLTLNRPGYYRVDVDESTTAFSIRRGGTASVVPALGEATNLADNQQIILNGADGTHGAGNAAPAPDAWDQWNDERTAQFGQAPQRSAQYVPAAIAGTDDLDRYGDWSDQPQYGHVWTPRGVGPDWAPYSTGRWVYDPSYQWTWVDDAPWGWAPYHYGRWVNYNGGWGWTPGPVIAAPVYSPALVAFFGAPGIGVSVGVGLPFLSWVALGFGEPIIPWWGQTGFIGRPYWGGWGGPHVVNNVVVNNTNITNITNVTKYQNVNYRNAVMGVDRTQFGRGRIEHVPLDAQRVQRLRPLHGDLSVRPVAASLAPGNAHAQPPPERLQARQVVATRPPQDTTGRLRARGIEAAAPVQRPAPRIVQSHAPSNPGTRVQAGVGAQVPGAIGRQLPPPVPGGQRPGPQGGPSDLARHPQAGAPEHGVPPAPPPARQAEHGVPQAPTQQQAAPQQRNVPPPPPQARQPEHAVPQAPAHQQAAPQQRSVPPPPPQARQPEHAVPQAPAHQQAAPQQRNVPPPPQARQPEHTVPQAPAQQQAVPQARSAPPPPQARQAEHAAPQAPAHQQVAPAERLMSRPPQPERLMSRQPQASSPERATSRQPSRPQAPAPEHAAQQQPAQHAPAQPHTAPQQSSRGQPTGGTQKVAHQESRPER